MPLCTYWSLDVFGSLEFGYPGMLEDQLSFVVKGEDGCMYSSLDFVTPLQQLQHIMSCSFNYLQNIFKRHCIGWLYDHPLCVK